MRLTRPLVCAAALSGLLACAPGAPDLAALSEPEVTRMTQVAPPGAEPGTCWGKEITPAIIETVTEQVILQPAEVRGDGTVTRPAIYKTETNQRIMRERRETWFQTPCPSEMTPEFIASIQRALTVRTVYSGPVNGQMDARTRAAIRRFQAPLGLDSGILSLAAARKLGLVSVRSDAPAKPA
jgi:hypothetical protein